MDRKIREILSELQKLRSIDFKDYRPSMLKRRIKSRMASLNITDMDDYLKLLKSNMSESENLINAIAINYSLFFRNPIVYEILAESILPSIIENKQKSSLKEIRIWSAGCACGEEVYTFAILLKEAIEKVENDFSLLIFATDIDTNALKKADIALYPRESFESTKVGVLDKYFVSQGKSYKLRPFIKKMVNFSYDDLTSFITVAPQESIFGGFDLILCRNVLIYFEKELQNRVQKKLNKSLAANGYLVLGETEYFDNEMQLKTVDGKHKIFQKV